jgi:pyrroline-5-carboxylate reductase
MGEALLGGMLRARWQPSDVVVVEKRAERAAQLQDTYGVRVLPAVEAAAGASVLLLVVKPQDMNALLADVSPAVDPAALVLSLAAGITTGFVEERLPEGVAVARAMPNTPALVSQGMAALSPGRHCHDGQLALAEEVLAAVGKVVRVPETSLDAVTAVSGSGPAYVFYVAEAMIDAGVLLGLTRAIATELVAQTIYGSATMLCEPGAHPTMLRENVTSPGGTTAAALRELDDNRVKAAFLAALVSARDRSRELALGS